MKRTRRQLVQRLVCVGPANRPYYGVWLGSELLQNHLTEAAAEQLAGKINALLRDLRK